MLEMRLRRAREEALRLLREEGMSEPHHIDPIGTATGMGIEIAYGRLQLATARIFRLGTKAARIRVSDQIVQPGRRRFSIAHELGHFVLGHELPAEARGEFATRACEGLFGVSPVAGARRFVELTNERCAVVYSERGQVSRVRRSPSFDWEIAIGKRLSLDSIAYDYFKKGRIDDVAQPVPADAWLEDLDSDLADVDIIEHCEPVPEWGGVISLLWVPERAASRLVFVGQSGD